MRRLDVLTITLGLFLGGGLVYVVLQGAGLSSIDAGIWTQALLVLGLVGWLLTYLWRALTQKMTYVQQFQDYEQAVLQKRLDSLSPEELAQLQAEVAAEKAAQATDAQID